MPIAAFIVKNLHERVELWPEDKVEKDALVVLAFKDRVKGLISDGTGVEGDERDGANELGDGELDGDEEVDEKEGRLDGKGVDGGDVRIAWELEPVA